MQLTDEQIKKINDACPYNQGIFKEPYGIPVHIKELVIYGRHEIGGVKGGGWRGNDREDYTLEEPKDRMRVLELVLEVLKPNITLLQYKRVERLLQNNFDTEREYYGNSTDWKIEYIILSELYNELETFN